MPYLNPGTGVRVVIEKRKQRVAALAIRGFKQTEIVAFLANEDQLLNPKTGKPFSLATINVDIKRAEKDWRKSAEKDIRIIMARELAKLDEIERAGWIKKDYELCMKCLDRRAKMLGYDAPVKVRPMMPTQEEMNDGHYDGLSVSERAARVAALLERARSERTRLTLSESSAATDERGSAKEPEIIFDGRLADT